MQVIGSNRVPFAVRSGGHASNPGFSSTTGVHIALTRMNQVVLSADKSSVEIGMGMVVTNHFIDIYAALTAFPFRHGRTYMQNCKAPVTMSSVGGR